jgi:hypothetical protein
MVVVHELLRGESRKEAFARMAADYPQNVAGKRVDDLGWDDDLRGAQERALAEHIAAHPEHAGFAIEDVEWTIRKMVAWRPRWAEMQTRSVHR